MPSFDVVNYSLRPSKSIQRQVVFDGIKNFQTHLNLHNLVYIGFGSIWFTDFVIAHKFLGIRDMISMEADDIGYARAIFNSPYATVVVRRGTSTANLPKLFADECISQRPWIIWLDYDNEFDEELRDDSRVVIEKAPDNTVFLITFNGNEKKYGNLEERPEHLRRLYQDVFPYELSRCQCNSVEMQKTLADLTIAFMKSVAASSMRSGGFIPAFRLLYKDSVPMVTVGGFLPSTNAVDKVTKIVEDDEWKCQPEDTILAPHLTIREATALQSKLPNTNGLSRDLVKELGFDLEDKQIEVYEKYYREYPTFAQIIT